MARLEKFPYLFLLAINFMAAFQKQSAKISIDYKALRSGVGTRRFSQKLTTYSVFFVIVFPSLKSFPCTMGSIT